jgi:hypothetical protein
MALNASPHTSMAWRMVHWFCGSLLSRVAAIRHGSMNLALSIAVGIACSGASGCGWLLGMQTPLLRMVLRFSSRTMLPRGVLAASCRHSSLGEEARIARALGGCVIPSASSSPPQHQHTDTGAENVRSQPDSSDGEYPIGLTGAGWPCAYCRATDRRAPLGRVLANGMGIAAHRGASAPPGVVSRGACWQGGNRSPACAS